MNGRCVMFAFRSPSLLVVSATLTCGSRGRGAAVDVFALMVGVRDAGVAGVVLPATRGVSGIPVRLAARVGLTGCGRPWVLRSDDIPGLQGYRCGYIEQRVGGSGGAVTSIDRRVCVGGQGVYNSSGRQKRGAVLLSRYEVDPGLV